MNRAARLVALAFGLLIAAGPTGARKPEGWPFLDFNEAVRAAKAQGRPLFVYFGFESCPYCLYLNRNTLASPMLRKQYAGNYVLGYFDTRGNPDEEMMLPDGRKMTRAQAIEHLSASPVPAWMFVSPEGKMVLQRRGARARASEFLLYDLYVMSGAYRQGSYEDFLARRGLRDERPE
ncbi:MAG: thioredoxin family protein [Burkholderiales bacterium]|nr:thioredoxin family protein [Burkholderiales bacterium]